MTSSRIEALASHFAQWAKLPDGVGLPARICATLASELEELADQVRRLEGSPVPPPARVLPHGNVVPFMRTRRAPAPEAA